MRFTFTRYLPATVTVMLACLFISPRMLSQSNESTKPIMEKPSKHSGELLRVAFGPSSGETTEELARRRNRENRRKNMFPSLFDPGRMAGEKLETTSLLIECIVRVGNDDPAPPSAEATTIVVGTVLGGQGFVSQDRTYVYSDYKIQVDEVIKPDPAAKTEVGDNVVVSRPGAAIVFPSGHVSHYMVMERGLPKVSSRYLLFLWRPDTTQAEYDVMYGGAYELAGDQAYPLDDEILLNSPEDSQSAKLLDRVRKAVRKARH